VADITPAPLTLRADDKSRELSQPTPPFTYTATGLVGGETTSLITGVLMSSIGSGAVPVGSYAITIGGAAAPNYVLNYVNGVLTVLADSATIPPTPTPGGGISTATNPNLATQSSLLLSLATNQNGSFTITQPGLTTQGQQMYLGTTALTPASPSAFSADMLNQPDMEVRTYRAMPSGEITPVSAPVIPAMPQPPALTPFKVPEVMDI
jgi:hypothetical protein